MSKKESHYLENTLTVYEVRQIDEVRVLKSETDKWMLPLEMRNCESV